MRKRNTQSSNATPPAEQIIVPPPGNLGGEGLAKNEALPPDLEVGTTGLAQFSGLIFQEPLAELRGKEAYKRYNEMRLNSPIVGALLLSIENPLKSMSYTFVSDKGPDDPRIDLCNRARAGLDDDCGWANFIGEAATMLAFGFVIFEQVYKRVGGEMLWRSFEPRGQDTVYRWLFNEIKNSQDDPSPKQRLAGFVQLAPPHYRLTPIPIDRLMIFRTRVERNNPEGRSILRTAWINYYFVKHLQQIEAIGVERDLAGLPVIRLPNGASTGGADTDDAKAARIVRNLRNDEQSGVVLPDGWVLELLSTGGARALDTDKIIARHEKRILLSALAQFLLLGQDGVGSLALSSDQSDFFTMSVNAVADTICEIFTRRAVKQLLELNGYPAEGVRLQHTPAQGETSAGVVADFLQKVGPYVTFGSEDEVWLRQVSGMPEKSIESIDAQKADETARKAAAQAAMLQKMQQGQQQIDQQPEKPKDPGQAGAPTDKYKASALDDAQRRKIEREWQQAVQTFFDAQKKRILRAAKELKK